MGLKLIHVSKIDPRSRCFTSTKVKLSRTKVIFNGHTILVPKVLAFLKTVLSCEKVSITIYRTGFKCTEVICLTDISTDWQGDCNFKYTAMSELPIKVNPGPGKHHVKYHIWHLYTIRSTNTMYSECKTNIHDNVRKYRANPGVWKRGESRLYNQYYLSMGGFVILLVTQRATLI